MAQTIATQRSNEQTADKNAIRPFHVNVPEAVLADLRQRLAQTRLPDKETVTDYSQGVPLKTVQQVLSYWQSDYDWRKLRRGSTPYRTSSPKSTGWISTSFMSAPGMKMHCL